MYTQCLRIKYHAHVRAVYMVYIHVYVHVLCLCVCVCVHVLHAVVVDLSQMLSYGERVKQNVVSHNVSSNCC